MSGNPDPLAPLLDRAQVWRGGARARVRAQSTGYQGLDALLPGGGWPVGALSEILFAGPGCGELQLVTPWLARLTRAGGRAALVCPPLLPYAPALARAGVALSRLLVITPESTGSAHWATEQMLRSGGFSAVLCWPGRLDQQDLRRLQLAAETGDACGLLYRDRRAEGQSSPAALRLLLEGAPDRFTVTVHKCRGGHGGMRWRHAA
ncbi:translesion DNA synthesis-associated protein ImuA [Algiphilus sp.]|uniref:translesion DNA synthesis-associated protein ImuA n=1 Tax=Algiphilus sp. TaxID=1872431 RepID=UPI0025BC3E70|nr:translesion DNA synthesis-associated protein ImuA [Algiphilus sp.]MCK5771582.1 translesion DNA synthesis-associated protein ImuA [Algiphilus sp.]